MIADGSTNVVFVADTLGPRFPEIYRGLKEILDGHGAPLMTVPGTRDIWCRDYMPVQVGDDRFVQFRYAPDYLTGKYRHLRNDGEIGPKFPWIENCVRSEIVLDGGNVVGWTDKVIVCDKVFSENPGWKPSMLIEELGRLLEVNRVILVPTEPGDVVGHSDGIVRFIGPDVVFVNDYRDVDIRYGAALRRALEGARLEVVELPYCPKMGRSREIPSAFGCYINFLRVGRVIIAPEFGLPEDAEALHRLQRSIPRSDVRCLDCRRLSMEGGVLNCVTWTIQC